jgi:hypothetical protein
VIAPRTQIKPVTIRIAGSSLRFISGVPVM